MTATDVDERPPPAKRRPTVLVVLAHPDPESLNEAIAEAAVAAAREAGGEPVVHHLYRDGFDPRLPASELPAPRPPEARRPDGGGVRRRVYFADPVAARYATDLQAADVIVVVHPVWFFHLPAVLKGWVDRIVREDVAFEMGATGEVTALLQARSALIVTTANSSPATEAALLGAPLDTYWRTIVFGPAGVRTVERLTLSHVRTSEAGTRATWLAEVAVAVARHVLDVG
ncbi:MAG TPA: NAD(P)H-dependent oxidoreductase [Trueperaceae bacterium]|nr:NAD(P)H-dependent oxidoreductase [Trueperaceae bacterium]